MTYEEVLELKMDSDIGNVSIRKYLHRLLATVLEQEECFSGKRPFGNSGWKYDIYKPLIQHALVEGKLDADGCVDNVNRLAADLYIGNLLDVMCGMMKESAQ